MEDHLDLMLKKQDKTLENYRKFMYHTMFTTDWDEIKKKTETLSDFEEPKERESDH